jgi:hypothetical protein
LVALSEVTQLHPINFALLMHFKFPVHRFPELHANITLPSSLPNLAKHINEFNDVSDSDKQSGLKLDKVVKSLLSNNPKSYSDMDTQDWNIIPLEDPEVQLGIFIAQTVVTALVLILSLYILFRLHKFSKKLTALMIQFQAFRSVKADFKDIESPYLTTIPPKLTQHGDVLTQLSGLAMKLIVFAAVVWLALTLVRFLARQIYQSARFQQILRWWHGPDQTLSSAHLFLKLCTEQHGIILFLMSLPWQSNLLKFDTAPYIQILGMKRACVLTYLTISWSGNLTVLVHGKKTNIALPTRIPIPQGLRSTLKKINIFPLPKYHLLLKLAGNQSYIEIPIELPSLATPIIHPVGVLNVATSNTLASPTPHGEIYGSPVPSATSIQAQYYPKLPRVNFGQSPAPSAPKTPGMTSPIP